VYCSHHQGFSWWWRQYALMKHQSTSMRLYGAISQTASSYLLPWEPEISFMACVPVFHLNKGTWWIVTLLFDSNFAVWQWTLPWIPGQNIRCLPSNVSF
jgi:hypothetical protein